MSDNKAVFAVLAVNHPGVLLRVAGLAMLYPRVRRDSVILRALADGVSVPDCDLRPMRRARRCT